MKPRTKKNVGIVAILLAIGSITEAGIKIYDTVEDAKENSVHAQMKSDRTHGKMDYMITEIDSIKYILKQTINKP